VHRVRKARWNCNCTSTTHDWVSLGSFGLPPFGPHDRRHRLRGHHRIFKAGVWVGVLAVVFVVALVALTTGIFRRP
jgi:hypothetical protein